MECKDGRDTNQSWNNLQEPKLETRRTRVVVEN